MEVIELTEKLEGEKWYYLTCFDFFNIQKDIIELRNKGDKEFSSIIVSVKIIDKGKPHDLKFGLNKNIDVISINEKINHVQRVLKKLLSFVSKMEELSGRNVCKQVFS